MKRLYWILGVFLSFCFLTAALIMDRSEGHRTYQKNIKIEYPANNIDGYLIADGVVLKTYRIIRGGPQHLKNTISGQLEIVQCSILFYSIRNNTQANFHWNGFAKIHSIRDCEGGIYNHKELDRLQWYFGQRLHNEAADVAPGNVYEGIIAFETIPEGSGHLFLEFDLY